MLFSEASGRKIVSTATAETVGKIGDFVVDPRSRAVVALAVQKSAGGDFLHWHDIAAFGTDAVTVTGADRLTAAGGEVDALAGKDRRILGKRVLTAGGDELGKVADVEFDSTTGVIIALALGQNSVEGVRLVGIGSYAVVVTESKRAG